MFEVKKLSCENPFNGGSFITPKIKSWEKMRDDVLKFEPNSNIVLIWKCGLFSRLTGQFYEHSYQIVFSNQKHTTTPANCDQIRIRWDLPTSRWYLMHLSGMKESKFKLAKWIQTGRGDLIMQSEQYEVFSLQQMKTMSKFKVNIVT
jgi:hypothetical protein